MAITQICISFVVALIGIAYPLMLQVISRLEDKYSSIQVLNLIRRETVWKLYRIIIISSLITVLIYIILNYPLIELNAKLFHICLHVIVIALIFVSVLLATSFILFSKKVFIYYSTTELTLYLIQKDRVLFQKGDGYLKAIADVLYKSIRQHNETIIVTISDYLFEVFHRYQDNYKDSEIEYPYLYYELVYKTIEELAILKEKKITFLEYRTIGGLLFFGQSKNHSIHESTYSWIWKNLLLAIEYKRDDYFMYYWGRAHNHITYNLPFIQEVFDSTYTEIRNKGNIEKRNNERERFLEFHYAIGGLLLYNNRYDAIGRIFHYTTSIPPHYELLPDTMDEIFKQYFKFRDPYDDDFIRIRQRYFFPNIEGINTEYIIKNWICKYLSLLFLRQYSLEPYYNMKPLDYPTIPESQSEKRMWLDNLKFFKMQVAEHLKNLPLLKSVGLKFLTEEVIETNENPKPMDFMDNLIKKVEQNFIKTEVEQIISENKKKDFFDFTQKHMVTNFEMHKFLNNAGKFDTKFKDWFITGGNAIIDKSSFADNQPAENMNYYSFLAESLSEKYHNGVSELFFMQTRKRYLFKPENLFQAIDNLKLSPDEHVIIAFGINLFNHTEFLNINGLQKDEYKGIKIHSFRQCNHLLAGDTLFVLRKDCLPLIEFLESESSDIKKYSLKKIDKEYNIYASIIDLFRDDNLRNELTQSRPEEDFMKSVYISIAIVVRFRWHEEMNMISVRIYSKYEERGLVNMPEDINPF
jgi:hypothetical protein